MAVLGFALMREFGRLERASKAMQRMTAGLEPFAAIPVTRDDEIGRLKGNFNRLVAERNRLEDALRDEIDAHKQAKKALEDAMRRLHALTEHMTQEQEEERRKIAFELHEGSSQELSALKMHLQMLEAQPAGEKAKAHLEHARTIVGMALERVRSLSLDLHSTELDQFGLYVALRGHCRQQADAAGWVMHFEMPEAPERPSRELELACFRVAEAALGNVTQHAAATEVWVVLEQSTDELRLTVRDNGTGFDPEHLAERTGRTDLGLIAMEERVRQVGGRLQIRSSSGTGTEIHAVFPLGGF
jgi:signal transduction histidine kinase